MDFPGPRDEATRLFQEILGPGGYNSISDDPRWGSDVSDDRTPFEFSVAFDSDGTPTIRILIEPTAEHPSNLANMEVSKRILQALSNRLDFSLDQFTAIQDLFLPEDPQGKFAMWYSLVLRPNTPPSFKLYFNPEVRGHCNAPALVREGFQRLGFPAAYETVLRHAGRRGHHLDSYSFFTLDLRQHVRPRVKVYVSHHMAEEPTVRRAAEAVPNADPDQVVEFCRVSGGGTGLFAHRPLISSYSFVEGDTDRPSVYTLYVPIRDYVNNDEEARNRAAELMTRMDLDPALLDRALEAVARRPLTEGVGMIPHLSLRLGWPKPGFTVYLSTEAFAVCPPRRSALVS
ncbi:tryptophan dimethylallyltransferase [Allokutzneria sp. A3M-2-11 16]|nr:tryptophan dimethylallyltransferase [Allokutzneria sp. A3M-2-11 16]